MSENKGAEKRVQKLKTRCYYTDYVNHMIRFYLTTPDTLMTAGKRKADVMNWMAVQAVFHCLSDNDKQVLTDIFNTHYRITEAVKIYCKKMGYDEDGPEWNKIWVLMTKTSAAIAKRRGLV